MFYLHVSPLQQKKRAAQNKKQKWFESKMNTFIYVSGLPKDVSEDELHEFTRKCGAIMIDPSSGQPKIKVYKDKDGVPKGDARICYANIESVEMAVEWLSGSQFREGVEVKVEQASFEMKGEVYKPK